MSLSKDVKHIADLFHTMTSRNENLPTNIRHDIEEMVHFAERFGDTLGNNPAFAAAFAASTMDVLTRVVKTPEGQDTLYLHPSIIVMCASIIGILWPESLDQTPDKEFTTNRSKTKTKKEDLN